MTEIWIGDDHLQCLQAVAEAASDFKLASSNAEFAEINGGIEELRTILFQKTHEWESFMASISED